VQRVRQVTDLPLALGFGISRPEQVAEAARHTEAVVVGSAIVRLIERHGGSAALEGELESFVRALKGGIA
jgi:tryptophan synthase alpha chain